MERTTALEILNEFIKNQSLINHNLAVEAAMRFYARKMGQDEEEWAITGLLHDFDWEIHPTLEDHPNAGAPILREKGVPETIIKTIISHGPDGIRETPIEKALFACDEITGLVTAVALVRPSKSLFDLKTKSVKKKWKNLHFAAGANREEIEQAAADFEIDLWEHTSNIILAMREAAEDLNLAGTLSSDDSVPV
ncbi:MAG: HDIG domain-containing protein [Anaerolineaceae bacterium]|nr:HDIG domain-containing protein [Anaerolineaceae bacterium]